MQQVGINSALIAILAVPLSACGGAVNSAPVPTPAPAAFPLTVSQSFQTITGTTTYTGQFSSDPIAAPSTATLQSINVNGRGDQPTISYNAGSDSYTLQSGTAQVALGAGNRIAATGYAHAFRATSGTVTDDVTLYGNALTQAPSVPAPIALSHTSFGLWKRSDSASGTTTQTFFVYGTPTGTAAMPRSGSATYQATASGLVMTGVAVPPTYSEFTGTATLSANFSANSISTTLDLGSRGTFQGLGSISADQFSGTFNAPYPNYSSGAFAGGFFGPNAAEVGYTFSLLFFNPDPFAGASPQPQKIWFSGVVVGKKN